MVQLVSDEARIQGIGSEDTEREKGDAETKQFCEKYGLICFEDYLRQKNRAGDNNVMPAEERSGGEGGNIIEFPMPTERYLRELDAIILCDYKNRLGYALTESERMRAEMLKTIEQDLDWEFWDYEYMKETMAGVMYEEGRGAAVPAVECMFDYVYCETLTSE